MFKMRKSFIAAVFALSTVGFVGCKADDKDMARLYTESSASHNNSASDVTSSRQNAITKAVERCSPAVVGINVTEMREVVSNPFADFFNDPFFGNFYGGRTQKMKVQSLGSGYIISSDGYILTNHHVAGNATKVVITMMGGEKFDAEVIGSDMTSDVALLKIKGKNFPYLTLGNSDKTIIGEWAIALGNPFGLFDRNSKPTITVGVVSNTDIDFIQEDRPSNRVYKGMIQTDAAISSGNSGGPLVNSLGEVIGMNTVIFSTSQSRQGAGSIGIGFAIPINRVKKIVDMIKDKKNLDRNYYTGLEVREIDEQIASYLKMDKKEGVVVFSIERRSPADDAGIEPGDIIVKINGKPTHRTEDVLVEVGDSFTGDEVNIEILRGDETINKSLKLKSRKGR